MSTSIKSEEVDHSAFATLESTPREGQTVHHDGKTFTTVREGLAHILVPENARTEMDPKRKEDDGTAAQSVFYNPIQQFNRDLSVLAIRAFAEDLINLRKARLEAKGKKPRKKKPNRGMKRNADESVADGEKGDYPNTKVKLDLAEIKADEDVTVVKGEPEEDIQNDYMPDVEAHQDTKPGLPENDATSSAAPRQVLPSPKPKFKILDALSATGLRALRYAHEIPFVTQVTANDLSKQATESIQANVKHNKLEDKITAVTGNAMSHMYSFVSHPAQAYRDDKYDVIDLDPYGTAATFLDGAVQALNDGGLLCVTCTDAGVWASVGYPEKCFSLYGGTPIKGLHSHEGGLRLILHSIATAAAKHGMAIEPLLSLSIDYYARVFVRVSKSPAEVKFLAGKTMLVYSCDMGCGAWKTQYLARHTKNTAKNGQVTYKHGLSQGPAVGPFCEHCGSKTHMNGPMFGGPLHNPAFIETILSYLSELDKTTYTTTDRIEGMLSTALEETLVGGEQVKPVADPKDKGERLIPKLDPAEIDAYPFYFTPSALAKVLHCQAPPEADLKGALRHAGYKAARSHAKPGVIRTDAPWSFIWEMMREWLRQKAPVKETAIKPNTAGWGIMHNSADVNRLGMQFPRKETHNTVPAEAEATKQDLQGEVNPEKASEQPREITNANIPSSAVAQVTGDVDGDIVMSTVVEQQDNKEGTAATTTASKQMINFDAKLGKTDPLTGAGTKQKRLVRYQTNPRANWGPMGRAKGGAAVAAERKLRADDHVLEES